MKTFPETKVYTASVSCLEDSQLYAAWLDRVPAQRREKAEKLRNPEVRRQSLGAGALLMCALTEYVAYTEKTAEHTENMTGHSEKTAEPENSGQELTVEECRRLSMPDPRKLRIEESDEGKPFLPDFPDIHFSLSHSADRVMCAVSHTEVGCDVEHVKDLEAGERRIRQVSRCLTPGEQELILADRRNFYRIWTLKESFLKLTGQGLKLPLKSFEITLDPARIRQDIFEAGISMKEYGQMDGYQYACMASGGHIADEMVCVNLKNVF